MKTAAWITSLIAFTLSASTHAATFHFRIIGEPETLDWNKAHTPVENYLMINLMEGLVELDENLKATPALAEKWTLSPDGKTYTFKLRPGVKWSDGVPLKAQDFVYSWKRLLSASTGAAYAYFLFDIENAESFYKGTIKDFNQVGVKALDNHTLQVKLTNPISYWIYIPSFWVTYPLRQDLVEKYGTSWMRPGKMVTVGPYNLAVHEPETRLVFKANPNYYRKRGNVDEVEALVVKEDSTALTLFESGKLDFMTDLPSMDLKRLAGNPVLHTFPYLKTGYLALVVTQNAMKNVHLRRAIAMAIDKTKFGELLFGGQRSASSFVPPKLLAFSNKVGLKFNPTKAKAELAAAGWRASDPIEVVIPNWDRAVTLAQYIQAELKKNLGLEVTIQSFDHKTFRSEIDIKAHPMFILSWGADYPDPDNFLSMWLSDSGNNRTGWKNPKYDELIVKARALKNASAREKLYTQAQRILLEDDAVIIPLYYDTNPALISKRTKGLVLSPNNYFYIRKVNVGS